VALWVKTSSGNYTNLDHCLALEVIGSGSVFSLQATAISGALPVLAGSWLTASDAQEAARELVDGVDSATYGD
jgi:hypothetical protein